MVMYFAYMRLLPSSRYILVGMGVYWLEYVIGIVRKVEWNAFVLSVTINHLAYFDTTAPKYGVFCTFKQMPSLSTVTTHAVNVKLLDFQLHYINSRDLQPTYHP
jgi:hypothetical protein